MRKILALLITIFCIAVYYVSLDDDLTKRLTSIKVEAKSPFGSDKYRFGDLYGMSNLSSFRKPLPERAIPFADCGVKDDINLYAICDSYLWAFMTSNKHYCGVDKLQYARVNGLEKITLPLDTSKVNVLLIGLVERNIRVVLQDSIYMNDVLTVPKATPAAPVVVNAAESGKSSFTVLRQRLMRIIFNKEVNTNLESNLWDYSFLTPVKEAKAALNYRLFHTTDKEVTLSTSEDQLFYRVTIDSTEKLTSSFNTVADKEVDGIVETINSLQARAKLAGFDTVYLTLIPNPVSILDPQHDGLSYNRLLERIQDNPALQVPYIDVMPAFRRIKTGLYYKSDTHWNPGGASLWLSQFNEKLESLTKKKRDQ